jgi:predicted nucleic-acid-binding protein
MIYLDTNVILRYLLQDCERHIEQSIEYVEKHDVYIKNEVLAEVVYVLNKTYNVPKTEVATTLKNLLESDNIEIDSKEVIFLALEMFASENIDFVDSLLCAYNKISAYKVVTFDKKLNKCLNGHF